LGYQGGLDEQREFNMIRRSMTTSAKADQFPLIRGKLGVVVPRALDIMMAQAS
jgi:hypothetical protein